MFVACVIGCDLCCPHVPPMDDSLVTAGHCFELKKMGNEALARPGSRCPRRVPRWVLVVSTWSMIHEGERLARKASRQKEQLYTCIAQDINIKWYTDVTGTKRCTKQRNRHRSEIATFWVEFTICSHYSLVVPNKRLPLIIGALRAPVICDHITRNQWGRLFILFDLLAYVLK